MGANTVIAHALNQGTGVSLSKITDTAPAARPVPAPALPVPAPVAAGLERGSLNALSLALGVLTGSLRPTYWILLADGGAWMESDAQEVADFQAHGFQVVHKITYA